ncbi:hypothetical protein, partial [uncultured Gimesia sp.]|uniref:hypothetical protein n=1 Tax=uncultured Gimesia sp. TaxID=1678688 RepID=UPI0030D72D31
IPCRTVLGQADSGTRTGERTLSVCYFCGVSSADQSVGWDQWFFAWWIIFGMGVCGSRGVQ